MKSFRLFFLLLFFGTLALSAQPPARQREASAAQNAATQKTSGGTSNRIVPKGSIREFPTAAQMPEDAVWRRDVYRRINLKQEENAPLYYPVTPTHDRANLFVYLFRLILRNQIKAYEYTIDANEHFDAAHVVKGRKIMDDNSIFYETVNGKLRLNDADLPSEDVKVYFLKESVYYDQHTATFRTKVTALCPVVMTEFGEGEHQLKPLFWVNYEEAAPHLAKLSLMGSNLNNAAVISADDYFSTNRYRGDIYKITNLQDRIIEQYAATDSAQVKERARIEEELKTFQSHVWGNAPAPKVAEASTDSLATEPAVKNTPRRAKPRRATRSSTKATAAPSTPKTKTVKSSSSSRTYSVRRQRR